MSRLAMGRVGGAVSRRAGADLRRSPPRGEARRRCRARVLTDLGNRQRGRAKEPPMSLASSPADPASRSVNTGFVAALARARRELELLDVAVYTAVADTPSPTLDPVL